MVEIKFNIPGKLPSLNDFLDAQKRHDGRYFVGNALKRKCENIISCFIPKDAKGLRLKEPVTVDFHFYEQTARRDPDNISGSAHKFILDALVKNKVLQDDSQRYIKGLSDTYDIDKHNPRIEVWIKSA